MTGEQLAAKGFIKHDGGGMPDCYEPNDLVDVTFQSGEISKGRKACWWQNETLHWGDCWKQKIKHHRPHISERDQLDMAIEALEAAEEWLQGWASAEIQLAMTERVLKTLKERQSND